MSLVVWRDPEVDPPIQGPNDYDDDTLLLARGRGRWAASRRDVLSGNATPTPDYWAESPSLAVSIEDLEAMIEAAHARAVEMYRRGREQHDQLWMDEGQQLSDAVARIRAALEGGSDGR